MPDGVGRVCCLPDVPGQLVSARAGAALVVAPDHGQHSADRAGLLLVFGLAARAPARLSIARLKRADARGDLFSAVASAQRCPVAPAVRSGLLHFADDGESPVSLASFDNVPHNTECKRKNRHSGGATPISGAQACSMTLRDGTAITALRGQRYCVIPVNAAGRPVSAPLPKTLDSGPQV